MDVPNFTSGANLSILSRKNTDAIGFGAFKGRPANTCLRLDAHHLVAAIKPQSD